MLVLAAAPPHTFFLTISLNSLDHEGVRLLSPHDSQFTSKTRCRCRWCRSRRGDWTQVGVRWGLKTLLHFLSRQSVVEPSWGDQGSFALGVVFFYFGSVVGPWLYLDDVMLYSCIVWCGDCKPTPYPFLIQYMGCVKITPLATCLLCGYASKWCSDMWEI